MNKEKTTTHSILKEVLGEEEYQDYQKSLKRIISESKKRGEAWLYPIATSRSGDWIVIFIKGRHWGRFFFEASSKNYQDQLKKEGDRVEESAEDMLLSGTKATIEEIQTRLADFIKKHHPALEGLPVKLFKDSQAVPRCKK